MMNCFTAFQNAIFKLLLEKLDQLTLVLTVFVLPTSIATTPNVERFLSAKKKTMVLNRVPTDQSEESTDHPLYISTNLNRRPQTGTVREMCGESVAGDAHDVGDLGESALRWRAVLWVRWRVLT